MAPLTRKGLPFLAAIALAFCVAALARITDWDASWTYVVGGFVGGVLLAVGLPFAFGDRRYKRQDLTPWDRLGDMTTWDDVSISRAAYMRATYEAMKGSSPESGRTALTGLYVPGPAFKGELKGADDEWDSLWSEHVRLVLLGEAAGKSQVEHGKVIETGIDRRHWADELLAQAMREQA